MADNWQLKAVLSAVDKMSPVLKQVATTAKTTRKYLLDVGGSAVNLAGRIGVPLALIGGAVSALSLGGLKTAIGNFAELGDQVVKSATRLGVSADEYQRLKYAAGQSGVSVEGLASSMGRLNKGIALAATGKNKDLAVLFKRAGISMRDANGNMRKSADLLPEIADLFERNKNAAVQARMGNAIFGKGWQELAPLLNGGKKGIEELNKRYEMLGLTMDENSLKAGEAFGDQLEDLQHVTASYGNVIASKLIPQLSPLIEKTIEWAVANREVIASKVAKFVEDIAISLKNVDWEGVIAGMKSFAESAKWVVSHIGGIKGALIALLVVMNLQTIVAFGQLGFAVFRLARFLSGPLIGALRAVWLAMMANPILLLIAAVVALAAMIYVNWDKIVSYITSAWDRVKAVFDVNFFDGLIQGWLEAWQGMANGILAIVKTLTPDFLMPDAMKNFNFSFATDRADRLVASGQPAAADLTNRLSVGDRPPLVGGSQVKASGQIEVSFKDAPPGMRVEQTKKGGDVPVNTNVGYRSYATNAQY